MSRTRRMLRFCGTASTVLLLVFGMVAMAHADDGPEVGPNIQVNDPQQPFPNDFPSRNTPTLAASEDGLRLLAGWEDLQGFCGSPSNRACPPQNPPGLTGFAFSTDGGLTWTDGGAPFPIGNAQTAGHPWVDRGGEEGNEAFFAISRLRVQSLDSAGVSVHRGRFAAGTFAWNDVQVLNSSNPNDFYSRPTFAAAKDGSGAAYVGVINLIELCNFPAFGFGQVEIWRTHDLGTTWEGPVVAGPDTAEVTDPSNPLCGLTGPIQVAPALAVGTHGEVYVVWQFGPRLLEQGGLGETSAIAFARSLDGGRSFDPPQIVAGINSMMGNPPVGYGKNRMNDQPRIAVATSGQHRGRVYVTFYQSVQPVRIPSAQQSTVSSQVFLTYSDDRGQTWSAPAPLAPPVPATGVKRFWPTVSVRPGGDVDVVYLESRETQATPLPDDLECNVLIGSVARRRGPLSSLVDTYWVQSRDGGASFGAPVRVSSETSNWCKAAYLFGNSSTSNFGDYLGIVSLGNRTLVAWPDGRNGVADVFFAEVKGKTRE